jgi:hypothetical protein
LFSTKDNEFVHFEFQTTNKKEDLKRFFDYDSLITKKYDRPVTTVVVYSSNITNADHEIDYGSIKYKIIPFYFADLDGDLILKELTSKIENKEDLKSKDMMNLTFLSLMKSKKSKYDLVDKSIDLVKKIEEENKRETCINLLYGLCDKFGDDKLLEKIEEVIKVTRLGENIFNKGINEGTIQTKRKVLINQLLKKFKKIPKEYREKISILEDSRLDILLNEIIDMNDIEEVEEYLN